LPPAAGAAVGAAGAAVGAAGAAVGAAGAAVGAAGAAQPNKTMANTTNVRIATSDLVVLRDILTPPLGYVSCLGSIERCSGFKMVLFFPPNHVPLTGTRYLNRVKDNHNVDACRIDST
jgi:hypothetical protein